MRALTPADIKRVADALKPDRLDADVTPVLRAGIEEWGTKVLNSLGASTAFDMRNPLIREHLDAWREQRVVGITDTTRSNVTDVLTQAVAEGVGIEDMKRRLRGFFDGEAYRAERVARTEVVSSSNAANVAAYQISGLVDAKEWLAVQDSQTRETHAALDGQRVPINAEFVSESGNRAQGPGLFGEGSEDINCRCTLRPVLNDAAGPVGEERAAEWRAFDAALMPWQDDIESATLDTFAAWEAAALKALA